MEWRERGGVRWLEADLGTARAAFSTRLGGVSETSSTQQRGILSRQYSTQSDAREIWVKVDAVDAVPGEK